MKTSKETIHTWVGALVFVLIAVFLVTSYFSDSKKGGDVEGMELTARFRSVDGITVGSPVMLTGIKIGDVTDMAFDAENYSAVLTMRVRDDLEIPYDSAAQIASDGVFGAKYVSIEPGAEFDAMRDGDVFEFTQDSIIIEELLEKIVLLGEGRRQERLSNTGDNAGNGAEGGGMEGELQ